MRHETATEEIQEVAALYALGALSQHEARAFEMHLRDGCTVCADLLRQFEDAVGSLALAASEESPSSYLRDLLTARIEREKQIPVLKPAPPLELMPEFTRVARSPARARSSLAWAVAACFALAAGISFELWREGRLEIKQREEIVSTMRREADRLKADLDREKTNSIEYEQLKLALNSPGSRLILLSGQPPAQSSSAQIYWDVRSNRWFVSANLPLAPSGKVYQLWFVTAEAKISAGLLKTDASGHGFIVINLPKDLTGLAAAAITLEPEGGSSQPTMPIYALGRIG